MRLSGRFKVGGGVDEKMRFKSATIEVSVIKMRRNSGWKINLSIITGVVGVVIAFYFLTVFFFLHFFISRSLLKDVKEARGDKK